MPYKTITSAANPAIKELMRLRRHSRDRKAQALSLIDGWKESQTALASGVTFLNMYYCPELIAKDEIASISQKADCPIVEVSRAVLEKISYGERHQGLVSVIRVPETGWESFPKNGRLILLIDGIEKPGNIGAIFRTADAAGVKGILLCNIPSDVYHPNVIRSSLGTVFSVPSVSCGNEEALAFLRTNDINITAADPQAKVMYQKATYDPPQCLVVGREDTGVSKFWLNAASQHVRIPMKGKGDSLNVSVSAAVLLYEVIRQHG